MITVAELDERIERCLTILAGNPHSQVFAALAEAYRRRGEFGRAFLVCKSGLKHHPKYAPAYVVMAKLFLHQRMLPDAETALKTAIEIDGPTRATDFLQAELLLEMGDINAVEPIIERLRRSEPRNPALSELVQKLKHCRAHQKSDAPVAQDQSGTDIATASERSRPSPPQEPLNWAEWAAAVRESDGVQAVFAWDPAVNVTYPVDAHTTGDSSVSAVIEMYTEIEALTQTSDGGAVCEVRVESDKGEVWCGRDKSKIIGLIGDMQMPYGEMRRLALALHSRIEEPANKDASESAEIDS